MQATVDGYNLTAGIPSLMHYEPKLRLRLGLPQLLHNRRVKTIILRGQVGCLLGADFAQAPGGAVGLAALRAS